MIESASDAWVNDDGTLDTVYVEEPLPGVSHTVVTDATGNTTTHGRDSVTATPTPGPYMASQNFEVGIYSIDMVSMHQGVGRGPAGTVAGGISSMSGTGSGYANTAMQSIEYFLAADRDCTCDNVDESKRLTVADLLDVSTGVYHNSNEGAYRDWPQGIMFAHAKSTNEGGWGGFPSGTKIGGPSGGTSSAKDQALDSVIFVLDVLGFVPWAGELSDGLAAALELSKDEADYLAAAISGLSAALGIILPTVSDTITKTAKWAWKNTKKLQIGDLAKLVKQALDKAAEVCADAFKTAADKIKEWWKKLEDFADKHNIPVEGDWELAPAGGPPISGKSVSPQTSTPSVPGNPPSGGSAGGAADGGKAANGAGSDTPKTPDTITPKPDDVPNAGNLKVQSDKWLKKKGIDAEALKKDFVGKGGAKWNIAVGDDGKIYLVPVQAGSGAKPQSTGLTIEEAVDIYARE
ncbi:MAG: hypothetical protein H6841_00950 [Planctomycetes bacterium]|nr:hypothetical protein [Planctomycetota bacterium]MCB9935929.1 hypothetical protein [Planctomycetota bacterium]